MRHAKPFLVLLATVLSGCAPQPQAGAQGTGPRVLRRATSMGVGVQVASYAKWNERCEAVGLPEARVVQEPPHGRLTARPALVTAGNRVFSGGTNCRDRQVQGIELWYQPDPGFRGTDPMAAEITNGNEPVRISATVDVR